MPDACAVIVQVCGILPTAMHRLVGVDHAFGGGFDMPLIWLVFSDKDDRVCVF